MKDDFVCRPIDRVCAVGKTVATDIYELLARRNNPAECTPELIGTAFAFEQVVLSLWLSIYVNEQHG